MFAVVGVVDFIVGVADLGVVVSAFVVAVYVMFIVVLCVVLCCCVVLSFAARWHYTGDYNV